jgi:ABC-type branched-subunit amino acid transport system substrate-binding protein
MRNLSDVRQRSVAAPRWKPWLRRSLVLGAGVSMLCTGLILSPPASGASGGYGLVIADVDPFSGPTAAYGSYEQAGCIPAVNLVNADGGISGHDLSCKIVDTRGDPADAVPAVQQLLATTQHLVGVVDQDSGLLGVTVPLFNAAHITDISLGGDVAFDHNHDKYFWRTIPGDNINGYALAAYIKLFTHDTKIASIFTTDGAAQGNIPGLEAGARNLGLKIVNKQTLALTQTSYETEIQQMVKSHAQVMASEVVPQTAGVLFGELKQANALIPGVLTSGTLGTSWARSMESAIGKKTFEKRFVQINQYAPSTGPAWQVFKKALQAAGRAGQVKTLTVYERTIYAEGPYDDVIMEALAMVAAQSTNPVKYNPYILKDTQGKVVVHTFAQGKKALEAGKTIDYVGVLRQITFDKYHNFAGVWGAFQPVTGKLLGKITPSYLAKAEGE